MSKISHNLSVIVAGTLLSLPVLASALSTFIPDSNGCTLSPDNEGCVLNRPIDLQRRAENEPKAVPTFIGYQEE